MFQIQSLEMVHWDFWQRLTVPLDAQIVTIIGPNGSGKTTLLDALRTLLALKCSGKRDYKRYVRHSTAATAWLKGVVNNPRRDGGGYGGGGGRGGRGGGGGGGRGGRGGGGGGDGDGRR